MYDRRRRICRVMRWVDAQLRQLAAWWVTWSVCLSAAMLSQRCVAERTVVRRYLNDVRSQSTDLVYTRTHIYMEDKYSSSSIRGRLFIRSTRNSSESTNKAGLNVRPSTNFSYFNQIWCVDRGRWVIDDGIPCDSIQGQGHGGPNVAKVADFKV